MNENGALGRRVQPGKGEIGGKVVRNTEDCAEDTCRGSKF